jgi:hypothetical protein
MRHANVTALHARKAENSIGALPRALKLPSPNPRVAV